MIDPSVQRHSRQAHVTIACLIQLSLAFGVVQALAPVGRTIASEMDIGRKLSPHEQLTYMLATADALCLAHIDSVVVASPAHSYPPAQIVVARPYEWLSPHDSDETTLRIQVPLALGEELTEALRVNDGQLDMLLAPLTNYSVADAKQYGAPPPAAPWVIYRNSLLPPLSRLTFKSTNVTRRHALHNEVAATKDSVGLSTMTQKASLVVLATLSADQRDAKPSPAGTRTRLYTISAILAGSTTNRTLAVYSDLPRRFPKHDAMLFLQEKHNGAYKLVGIGEGVVAIENGALPNYGVSIQEARQQVDAATKRAGSLR